MGEAGPAKETEKGGLAVDVGFGVVDVFGALRVEGMEVSLQWVKERKEKEKSEIVRKPHNSLKVFSVKESRVRGEGQGRVKMGYNCITFVLSHFLTLKKYKEECLIWCLFPPDIDDPIKCIWVFTLSVNYQCFRDTCKMS